MKEVKFSTYNKELIPVNQKIFSSKNRAFRYGDGLFETMRSAHHEVQLINQHTIRLLSSMRLLKMEIPFGFNAAGIHQEIKRLLSVNKIFGAARIRLSVFRNDGGLYTPKSNTPSFLIECEPVQNEHFKINEKGLNVDIFTDHKKAKTVLSNIKSINCLPLILAGIYKKENQLDDVLICNTEGNIIEGLSSNLFIVKDDIIITPPLSDACVGGIMRNEIIQICKKEKLALLEQSITQEDILKSSEIFLTNAIKGIQWISAFRDKRYLNTIPKILVRKLNEKVFN
ncbi:MAG: aminotransferase class IV [Marinilabiliales bacterium]|nr:MAG: aminotransferase class IV [Marinilabiliales bacterium]